jgi:hypothetical protein
MAAVAIPDEGLEAVEKEPVQPDPHALANEARALVTTAKAQGRTLSFADAVAQAQRTPIPA